jgi:hypothetical protein
MNGQNHGKVNQRITLQSGHQVGLGILNLEILFTLMFNYMKFFDFATIIIF